MKNEQRMPWFKWWAKDIESDLSQFNSDLEAVGLLIRILNKMWLDPHPGYLCYKSGKRVPRSELGEYLSISEDIIEAVLPRILLKSGMISVDDNGGLKSEYLVDLAESWRKHKRGDR